MEEQLAKIRPQIHSKLENQKQATTEETLDEQQTPRIPTAYYAALLTTLDGQIASPVAAPILYLLDIVLPHVPQSISRQRFTETLTILLTALKSHTTEAPIVRSVLGCLEALIIAQDGPTWKQPTTRKAFQALIMLCNDGRPKVRKRAQDAVRNVVTTPPLPMVVHPAAGMVADWCLQSLSNMKKRDESGSAIHVLTLLKHVVVMLPAQHFNPLCETLLQLPKMNNAFLTIAAFEVFESLFGSESISFDEDKFVQVLRALLELKPSGNDEQVLPAWLNIVASGMTSYYRINPNECTTQVPQLFSIIFADFHSGIPKINTSIAQCLSTVVRCITDDFITEATTHKKHGLKSMIKLAEDGLSIHYQDAWAEVLVVIQALFKRLRRSGANLMKGVLSAVGELRLSPDDLIKPSLDATLGAAITHAGPAAVLAVLPLNLETPTNTKSIGRAFMLPLLKEHIMNTEMAYFSQELMPLADRLLQKSHEFSDAGRAIESKIYDTLFQQIWSLVPGFCDLPTDLPQAFTMPVAEKFSKVLYSHPDLRPAICQGLGQLIVKNNQLAKSDAEEDHLRQAYGLTKQNGQKNIELMRSFAANYLAVFFNIYSQTVPMYRSYLSDVITTFLSITSEQDIRTTYAKVSGLLKDALEQPSNYSAANDPSVPPPMSHTMLDLAISMAPFLDHVSAQSLYQTATSLLAREDEPQIQKKAYKVLNQMATCTMGKHVLQENIEDLQSKLLESTTAVTPSSRKDRLQILIYTVDLLPTSDLHLIPSILSEAVLCTKEVNERSRDLAYELLVDMGRKMAAGGTVVNSKVEGMEEGVQDVTATIGEYFLMVTAGLAGSTPHMISASVASLSRLLFEFKDSLAPNLVSDLLSTMHHFVISSNREIVKSSLGFVKVAIVSLEPALLQNHLGDIVKGILTWSHEHKSHFKAKVRHIFERLIRRFGYEEIDKYVPEDDKKLLINIRKRRERAKRKKQGAMEVEDEDMEEDEPQAKPASQYNNAYEDALYGSESELESDTEEAMPVRNGANKAPKSKKEAVQSFIREDEEGPLDFLDRAVVGKVTSSKPDTYAKKAARVQSMLNAFASGEDGRMVINETDSEAEAAEEEDDSEEKENYYMEAQRSADGFTRGQGNRIKFNKRQRDADDDMMDVDIETSSKAKKKKGRDIQRIGAEFKAKRAGGDVKRKGKPDPYAYVPLTKVIKKKGKHQKMSFTGKLNK
ncbi:hypothetical protein BZG36_03856 [Bifiguratus adelaidae]|uniref:Uncharacterized protein n=1 Tax=Bifiguratus adelaidae TaxID=1938954 RepID=A0A261XWH3_9FUNG|nr:hypothetical protein BZG36_03856 [Bifiguratus adelaidae]